MTYAGEKPENRSPFNRLREIRERDLKMSLAKFAKHMGGEEAGWYSQRLHRLETGETALTDEVAADIAKKLGIPVASLFSEPKVTFSNYDKEFLTRYYALPPQKRKDVDDIVFAPTDPSKEQ